MAKTSLTELDVVFISFDEPNADENYANLLQKVPWSKRVHGVEGSDQAHKEAAKLSETDRFISVDADNIVDAAFFDQEIDFEHPKFKDKVISWSARHSIHGLEYGNGGLKCWPVKYVMDMRTHENCESDEGQIDFCWKDTYVQMNNRYCETRANASPLQSFRGGFREGVKMSLDQGKKVDKNNFEKSIWYGNYQRLLIWCSVGADAENGLWAMYGARLGCMMTNLTDWDYIQVRDFKFLNELWNNEVAPQFASEDKNDPICHRSRYRWNNDKLLTKINNLGEVLRKELGMEIAELDATQSKFYKKTYSGIPRTGTYMTEEEMIQLKELNK